MRDLIITAADHEDLGLRTIVSKGQQDGIQCECHWLWQDADSDGSVMVATMPLPGDSGRISACIYDSRLDALRAAWDAWHALIDDRALIPDAVLHWLAEVTPPRHTDTETQEETTT